ncbi:hypothetical protein [Aeromicrobium sp. CTD01-1L150]|uniref:hypothetical protein n=1 Tax=Aeromicrobium sp. CTD01-1L150 TaxID=3341830 RepID=UPI0035C14693
MDEATCSYCGAAAVFTGGRDPVDGMLDGDHYCQEHQYRAPVATVLITKDDR